MHVCDSEAQEKMYLGGVIRSDRRSENLGLRTLRSKKTNPHKLVWMLSFFFCLCFSSLSLITPLICLHFSLFSLLLPFPEGPSLNPRERGRSLGWRGRAGNPCSDPGQFNYPVFFCCATRVPISQPTPLMRPGLASLTFNDLPIDALGPPVHTHRDTQIHTHIYTRTHLSVFHVLVFSVKEFVKQLRKPEDQERLSQNKHVCACVCMCCACICMFMWECVLHKLQ